MSQNRRRNNPQDMTLREQISQRIEQTRLYVCTNICRHFEEYKEKLEIADKDSYAWIESEAKEKLNEYCKNCEVRKL